MSDKPVTAALRHAQGWHAESLSIAADARRKHARGLEFDADGFWRETHARCLDTCRYLRGRIANLNALGALQAGARQ